MSVFLIRFVALSIVSGCTIGINKILITLFGLSLSCTNWQLGLIGAAETLGLALGTLPAGLLVSRGSPRVLFGLASLVLAGCYLVIPHLGHWMLLLPVMLFSGFFISFRIVSMNATFLERLGELGPGWAGWYKGTLSLGILSIGPWSGHELVAHLRLGNTFLVSAGLFAALAVAGLSALPGRETAKVRAPRDRSWLLAIWNDRLVRKACAMEGVSGASNAFFSTFMLVILLRDRGWPEDQAIHLLVEYGAVYVLVLLAAGWVLARVARGTLDRAVYASTAFALAGLSVARSPAMLFACTALFALGLGFNNLINATDISASRCDRGHVSGVATLLQMSGGCLGSFTGGLLGGVMSLQTSFGLFAAFWLLGLALRPGPALAQGARRTTVREASPLAGSAATSRPSASI